MKKILAVLLALVMVMGLAACGGNSGSTTTSQAPASEAPASQAPASQAPAEDNSGSDSLKAEITFATYPVGKMTDEATVNALIADFNAVYPDVKVNVQYLDYTNGDDTVNTAIEAGTAPDIVFEGPERLVATWGAKGYLVDLKDLVQSEMFDVTVSSCTSSNGAVYELPVCQTAHCMAINKDIFEAAGAMQYLDAEKHTWTTDNFVKAVQAVYDYGHKNVGIVFCGGQGGDQGNRALITNLYGGTYAKADHTGYTANCAENVKALELLKSMDGITFDPASVGGDEVNYFCNGTLAMATCWNVALYNNNKDVINFEVLPMAFPTNSGDPILQGGIWGFGVFDNGDENRIAASKAFIEFMLGDGEYTKIVEATGYWAVKDVAGLYAGNELMEEYGLLAPYMGDYYQITKGWAEARTAWWNALQSINSGTPVQEALDSFVETANAAAAAA